MHGDQGTVQEALVLKALGDCPMLPPEATPRAKKAHWRRGGQECPSSHVPVWQAPVLPVRHGLGATSSGASSYSSGRVSHLVCPSALGLPLDEYLLAPLPAN